MKWAKTLVSLWTFFEYPAGVWAALGRYIATRGPIRALLSEGSSVLGLRRTRSKAPENRFRAARIQISVPVPARLVSINPANQLATV